MGAVMNSPVILGDRPLRERRSVERLLAPLEAAAEKSPRFISKSLGHFENDGHDYSVPRYVRLGAKGGGDTIRIGIFATLRGNEPEGALALARFVDFLDNNPAMEISKGYALFLYPVCNPTGFEDNTAHSRTGKNLDEEFWRESAQPEVRHLQSEIWMYAFDGIITLRSGAGDGLYGCATGAILSQHLLGPALREAEHFIPGGSAQRELRGVRAPVGLQRPPFEIILQTPRTAPLHRQAEAFSAALRTILIEYRYLIAIAQNI